MTIAIVIVISIILILILINITKKNYQGTNSSKDTRPSALESLDRTMLDASSCRRRYLYSKSKMISITITIIIIIQK